MTQATLSHGHVLQSSVEDVQIDNVRDLLKVEKGGLGTNRSEFVRICSSCNLNKRDEALPEKVEDFVENVIFPILSATIDFVESPAPTSLEHVPHKVAECLGEF